MQKQLFLKNAAGLNEQTAIDRLVRHLMALAEPYVMVGCNAIVADTEDEARHLFTTPQQQFTRMVRGARGLLPPPIDDIESFWSPMEKSQASSMLACSFYGSPETIKAVGSTTEPRTHTNRSDDERGRWQSSGT